MIAHDRRARRQGQFQLEPLEDRSLMNATLPNPHALVERPTAHVRAGVVSGTVGGLLIQPPLLPSQNTTPTPTDPNQVPIPYSLATGTNRDGVTFLAAYDVQRDAASDPTLIIQGGNASISSTRLGTIAVGYAGTEHQSANGSVVIKINGPVTGTLGGLYSGDTGSFHATAFVNPATGYFTLKYTLDLHRSSAVSG